ncbi:hypothetical protein QTI33_03680 [Variovorax sp. J22P271]|uniref:hypothetical protein n=1 Tax=Variovorax davisae TaxID=3053515 RepID=UPI002575B79F|nr:hypothetical protein [Variovorax sp. J22P271]MDM0031235.1 hypothetical protein [Variovorax sp. J22P271]
MNPSTWRPPTDHARINQFAIACFRDTADADYIAARAAMRARLAGPFLWSALHSIEKYLKCILMLNRQSTIGLKHKIAEALDRINASLPFAIRLDPAEQEFVDRLVEWNGDRYLLQSYHLFDSELLRLDRLVWKLRQYCQPLDVVHYADPPSPQVLASNIKRIEAGMSGPAQAGHVPAGKLEQILADRKHASRDALVWANAWYCVKPRTKVWFTRGFQGVNSPLWLYPELAGQVALWMEIPKSVLEGARQLVDRRKRTGEKP